MRKKGAIQIIPVLPDHCTRCPKKDMAMAEGVKGDVKSSPTSPDSRSIPGLVNLERRPDRSAIEMETKRSASSGRALVRRRPDH